MWNTIRFAILFSVTVTGYIINPRSSNVAGSKKHDVYIAGFFPFDDSVTESEIGRGVLPAVRLAVDHINDNPTVLRNYILHLWWNDTKVRFWFIYEFYASFVEKTEIYLSPILPLPPPPTLFLGCFFCRETPRQTTYLFIIFFLSVFVEQNFDFFFHF